MPMTYPPGWPSCPRCGAPALDGHITCGAIGCDESGARRGAAMVATMHHRITAARDKARAEFERVIAHVDDRDADQALVQPVIDRLLAELKAEIEKIIVGELVRCLVIEPQLPMLHGLAAGTKSAPGRSAGGENNGGSER